MGEFFNYDGPFFNALNKITDLIILNLLWLICCIPVITIGASTTAMLSVTIKMQSYEVAYPWKDFFKAFKANFKQSTIIWLIMLFLGCALVIDYYTFYQNPVLFTITMFIIVMYLLILTFVFPLQAKFTNKIRDTFKNAALLSIKHLPSTIIIIAMIGLACYITSAFLELAFLWVLIAGSGLAYGASYFYNRIFNLYIKEEDKPVEPVGDDEWTLPDIEEKDEKDL